MNRITALLIATSTFAVIGCASPRECGYGCSIAAELQTWAFTAKVHITTETTNTTYATDKANAGIDRNDQRIEREKDFSGGETEAPTWLVGGGD